MTETEKVESIRNHESVDHMQISLVREWREVVTEVSDYQSMAASLQQSPFFAMFRDQIEGWVKRLATLQEGLSSMAAVQRKWVYLEPIFSRGALPNHASRFRQVQPPYPTFVGMPAMY